MFRHIILFISLYLSLPLYSEDYSFGRGEAVAYALEHNRELKAASYIVEAAEARRRQIGRLPNPEVSVDYSDDFAFNNEGESLLGMAFSQSFPFAGRLKHAKRVSNLDIDMARIELRETERDLSHKVAVGWTAMLALQTQIDLRQQQIDLNQQFVDFISKRVETGEVSVLDKNQAELELKVIEQEISFLGTELVAVEGEMLTLLGLDSSAELVAKGDLQKLVKHGELSGFASDVLERRPDYQLVKLAVESAEARVLLAKSEKWADVSIGLMFENEKSVDDPKGLGTDRFLGVGVSVPLPLWNRNKGNIREEMAHRRHAAARLHAFKLEIKNEVDVLRVQALRLQQTVSDFRSDVLSLAKSNAEVTQQAYGNGQVDLVSVLKAQEQRLELESAYLDTLLDYAGAKLKLSYARAENVNL